MILEKWLFCRRLFWKFVFKKHYFSTASNLNSSKTAVYLGYDYTWGFGGVKLGILISSLRMDCTNIKFFITWVPRESKPSMSRNEICDTDHVKPSITSSSNLKPSSEPTGRRSKEVRRSQGSCLLTLSGGGTMSAAIWWANNQSAAKIWVHSRDCDKKLHLLWAALFRALCRDLINYDRHRQRGDRSPELCHRSLGLLSVDVEIHPSKQSLISPEILFLR